MVTHDPAPETNGSPSGPEPEAAHDATTGSGYYAGANEVARHLEATGLTPPRAERHGRRRGRLSGEFCTVEATPRDHWPKGAVLCVEVVHHPAAEYRWRFGESDPPNAAEHRWERLRTVAGVLRAAGYTVEIVERDGWRPGQQALRVTRFSPAT
ncbi:hypothetical protein [Streptomyces jumonjinensis]|uniref:hypothetical protein n=1 Tax=Streptomyces jumonjinensis TaxID=1945 RepID=UPI003796B6BB